MILWAKNNLRIISAALIIVAMLGFFLSAVVIKIDMLGISEGLGARNACSLLSGTTSSQPDISTLQTKLLEIIDGNDAFAEVKAKLAPALGAYFLVIILPLINLVFVLLKKWEKARMVIPIVSLALFSYAGYSVMSLSKILYAAIEESFGFLAVLVNISEMVKIHLGIGYWLTLSSLTVIFAIDIVVLVADRSNY